VAIDCRGVTYELLMIDTPFLINPVQLLNHMLVKILGKTAILSRLLRLSRYSPIANWNDMLSQPSIR
jgi:hypothetical protein